MTDQSPSAKAELLTAVCSNRKRPSVHNNHSSHGNQYWAHDAFHVTADDNKTLCGRDLADWLAIGPMSSLEALDDPSLCKRCAAKLRARTPNAEAVTEGAAGCIKPFGWTERNAKGLKFCTTAVGHYEIGKDGFVYSPWVCQYPDYETALKAITDDYQSKVKSLLQNGAIEPPPPARIDEPDTGKLCAALQYYKPPFTYEPMGQSIHCAGFSKAVDVRGWGNLIGGGANNLPHEKAGHIQDEFGQWVCDAMNAFAREYGEKNNV